jgi:hypothetical protein
VSDQIDYMASVVEDYILKTKGEKIRINRRLVAMDGRQLVMLYNAYQKIVNGAEEHDHISKEPPGTPGS